MMRWETVPRSLSIFYSVIPVMGLMLLFTSISDGFTPIVPSTIHLHVRSRCLSRIGSPKEMRPNSISSLNLKPLIIPLPSSLSSTRELNESKRSISCRISRINRSISRLNHSSGSAQSADGGEDVTATPLLEKLTLLLSPVAMVLSFAILIAASGPGGWRYYLAGGICASTSHAVTTPIDVVKTRQQVDKDMKNKGMIKSTLYLIKKEGISSLFCGLGPTTFGYLIEGAIKFGIYEVLKPVATRFLTMAAATLSLPFLDSKLLGFTICAASAGLAGSAVLCPMEALRIRLVAKPAFAEKGWIHGGTVMLKNEGLGGMWKGMTAMMSKQIPYTITKQVSFDLFAMMAYLYFRNLGLDLTVKMKVMIPLASAMAASFLSCIASQPGDMLLSVVNAHEGNKRTRDFSKEIMKKDGLKGFFVGIQARFLHVGIIVSVQLMIYDFVKRAVGIPATGL